MKVLSLNSYNPVLKKQNRQSLNYELSHKQDRVCFRGYNLLNLPEEDVLIKVQESVKPENFIGQGTEAEVYRIKDTDYCVRIPYIAQSMYAKRISKDLSLIDKINHVVARLSFGASIMKYFEGVVPKRFMNNSHSRYQLQEKIADMPIKSYSKLIHQIGEAVDNELLFDFSPGNLIIDTDNKKLTAIDFYRISDNPRPIKPLSEVYSVLTCYGSLEKTGKKIFDKIIDSGLEEFKPKVIPCMDVALFDFLEVCLKRMGEAYTPNGEKIKSIIMYESGLLKNLKKTEILDKAVSGLLEQKICSFRQLLKSIH